MNRNRLKLSGLLPQMMLLFLWGLLAYPSPQAMASPLKSGHDTPAPASEMVIGASSEGVTIQVTQSALGKVLQNISEQSHIQFKVSGSLSDLPVTAGIRGKNWDSAVRELLRNYGTVEMTDESGHLSKVFILKASDQDSVEATPKASRTSKNPRAIGEIKHTEAQLRDIGGGLYYAPLSEKLFNDPQYKGFLVQNGIQTVEDLKDPEKAKHVRWVARRYLKELMKRNRLKKAGK